MEDKYTVDREERVKSRSNGNLKRELEIVEKKKMMDRVYNVEKGRKRACTKAKKRYYHIIKSLPHSDDNVDASDSIDALNIELEKPKPRKDVVLSLMKSTYYPRRTFILNDPGTVSNKVTKYSAFMMPSVVSE